MTDTAPVTPAYLPWKTFTNTLAALAQHMPNRIDRSAFPGQSGATQNQLLLAFKFFGLTHPDGRPTEALERLAVNDEDARRAALRKLIEQHYAPLFTLGLTKTTPVEFAEKMTDAYKVTGDTRIKATRFFVNAATSLGIPVSPLLLRDKTKAAGNGVGSRRRKKPRVLGSEAEAEYVTAIENLPEGEHRSVELKSGGTLTISASTKFMSLSSADRAFVFGLIDKLEEYEASAEDREA